MDGLSIDVTDKETNEVLRTLCSLGRGAGKSVDVTSDQEVSQVLLRKEWHCPISEALLEPEAVKTIPPIRDSQPWQENICLDFEEHLDQDGAHESQAQDTGEGSSSISRGIKVLRPKKKRKVVARKNYGKMKVNESPPSDLENSSQEVRKRFEKGCECNDDCCFRGLSPESVFKHRLNIAELTKEEHDMYLMGVTMACMSDPVNTVKRRARQRLRSHYVYQGRKVCLAAFLYLENCTLYQLKRIRKHVMTHGVTPRIHGNHGKTPHNMFSLDIYKRATSFLKNFIKQHTTIVNNKSSITLPPDVTRKAMHDSYKQYVQCVAPAEEKVMGYSTFKYFMKDQFPLLRFAKAESRSGVSSGALRCVPSKQQPLRTERRMEVEEVSEATVTPLVTTPATMAPAGVEIITIPLILSQTAAPIDSATYTVAPLQQLIRSQEFPNYQPVALSSNAGYTFAI